MAISYRLTITPPIERLAAAGDDAEKKMVQMFDAEMRILAKAWEQIEKNEVPIKTGNLRDSISTEVVNTGQRIVLLGYIAKYGDYVSKGTDEHPIVARNAKWLHFYWEKIGEEVWFKSVWHPGIKNPDDFMQRSWDKWYPKLESMPLRIAMQYSANFAKGAK